MKIKEIRLQCLKMKMKYPFQNSISTVKAKEFYIVSVVNENDKTGYGETVAFDFPWYTEETVHTNLLALESYLIPLLRGFEFQHPNEISKRFAVVKRNHMAKAALEGAIWDLYAKERNLSLANVLGGTRQEIKAGISLGIQPSIKDLLYKIEAHAEAGCPRIKVKIKQGWDLNVLKEIRASFPTIPLMVDANSAYNLQQIDHLRRFDEFDLIMIEQPFADGDFLDHAILQKQITTPICLDESIHSFEDTRLAINLGSCQIINIKIGRVGGLFEAKRIHDFCLEKNVPVWCGGMLEAGIGRAHNIALASLPGFTLPGDIGGSSHYWEKDIITPEVIVQDGRIQVPNESGIGFALNEETIANNLIEEKIITF